MSRHRFLSAAALLFLAAATPLKAQRVQDFQYRWYWGLKGGMVAYSMPTSGQQIAPHMGADWLITRKSVALYLSYLRSFQAEQDTFSFNGLNNQTVAFDSYQQIQANVVALIGSKNLQPYVGGGFVMTMLGNARDPANPNNQTVSDAITDAASSAFLQVMAGVQFRMGRKGQLFGQYSYTPQGRNFLLAGGGHVIEGGFRYAFLSSKESDPTLRR